MTKTYLNLSTKEIYQMKMEVSYWPRDRKTTGPERDKAENGKLSSLGNSPSLPPSPLSFSISPHPPLALPTLPSPPTPPTGPYLNANRTTDTPGVGQGERICSPPPAKTLYPEFPSGPRAPSRATVPFLSTGLPLTLPPLALKATSDVKSHYLSSGLRPRPKFCFQEAAVWAICSLWFNQIWPRGQIQVEQTWLPRAILCGWVQFSDTGVMLTTTQWVNAPDLSTVEISVVTKSKPKRVRLRFPLVQSRGDGFGGKEWTTI